VVAALPPPLPPPLAAHAAREGQRLGDGHRKVQGTCKRERNGGSWAVKRKMSRKSPVSAGSRAGTAGGKVSDVGGDLHMQGRKCCLTWYTRAALDLMQIIDRGIKYVGRALLLGRSISQKHSSRVVQALAGTGHVHVAVAVMLMILPPSDLQQKDMFGATGSENMVCQGRVWRGPVQGHSSGGCGGLFSPRQAARQAAGQAPGLTACSWEL
jgi:hypothetical protein